MRVQTFGKHRRGSHGKAQFLHLLGIRKIIIGDKLAGDRGLTDAADPRKIWCMLLSPRSRKQGPARVPTKASVKISAKRQIAFLRSITPTTWLICLNQGLARNCSIGVTKCCMFLGRCPSPFHFLPLTWSSSGTWLKEPQPVKWIPMSGHIL